MPGVKYSLHFKITGILLVFFVVAFAAIGLTLFTSWQLKGSAAAINDAGSLRMGAYRIAHLLGRADSGELAEAIFVERLRSELARYDRIMADLIAGDPQRPLFTPGGGDITAEAADIASTWSEQLRPALIPLVDGSGGARPGQTLTWFEPRADELVERLNQFVSRMEQSYTRDTTLLRASQVLLVLLALTGTVFLIRFFAMQVIHPITTLRSGLEQMEGEDFSARVPIERHDELGELAAGFNRMAAHLQDLYHTLEQRVHEKTVTLTAKNRELEILYSISSFLHEPHDMDSLCRGFLRRIQETMGASASSIRLMDSRAENLCMTYCEGLDESFLDVETVISCTECLCGEAAEKKVTFFSEIDLPERPMTLDACRKAGFRAVTASTISVNKRSIGIFNLFFDQARKMSEADRMMLSTLGEQLGVAIDSLRLQARERELAVSEERNLLARELHDSIAQGLAFMNLQAQMCEQALERGDTAEADQILALIRQSVQESYDDVRELLVHFRARVGQQDLETAVEAALRRLSDQTGIQTSFESLGGGAPLDPETETQLLYIVQEALSNVRKHAQARSVDVRLRRGLDGVAVSVRDDGIGFEEEADPTGDAAEQAHIGLHIMRERAQRIGARFTVRSAPGRGTEVRAQLARRHEDAHEEEVKA